MTDPDDLWPRRAPQDDSVQLRVAFAAIVIAIIAGAIAFWVGLAVLIVWGW